MSKQKDKQAIVFPSEQEAFVTLMMNVLPMVLLTNYFKDKKGFGAPVPVIEYADKLMALFEDEYTLKMLLNTMAAPDGTVTFRLEKPSHGNAIIDLIQIASYLAELRDKAIATATAMKN